MKLFNSMVSKAVILNEARSSSVKFEGWGIILKVTREINDYLTKKYGNRGVNASGKPVPNVSFGTPINELSKRAHAILSDVQNNKIDSDSSVEDIEKDINTNIEQQSKSGANYSDLKTMALSLSPEQIEEANKVWLNSIAAGDYGQGIESWARRCIFDKPKNRKYFEGLNADEEERIRTEINEKIHEYFQGSDLSQITSASQTRTVSKKETEKPVVKAGDEVDTGKVDLVELKVKILPKFDNPRMKQGLINSILETETDDHEEAQQFAEDAILNVADAIKSAQSIDDLFEKLGALQHSLAVATGDLAEAAFNYLKKIIPVEDEEISDDQYDNDESEERLPTSNTPNTANEVQPESYITNYMAITDKAFTKHQVVFESNRKKFKPKNIHQLIQRQYEGR